MMSIKSFAPRLAATALAIAGLVLPAIASAQGMPSYAAPNQGETIQGRIVSVNDTFNISVRDDRGFVDNVELHQGTIINPTGLTLAPGMAVTIAGVANGNEFDANEIDTPYNYDGPVPVPYYYGPGWWFPGYAYGYGPSFGISLFFGGGGWYYRHGPFYGHAFAYNGRGFVPRAGVVGRVPLGTGRAVEPAGRSTLGAWRSFETSRGGYGGYTERGSAVTGRSYSTGVSRGYTGGTSRGYTGGTSRGYTGGTSRGYASRSYSSGASRGGGSRGSSSASRGGGGRRH